MQRPARAHGFTLLELLVAMIILSLIMTIAFSALRVGIKSWNLSAQRLNESADLRAAYRFIANKITHCYPMTWRTGQKEMPAFEGDAQGFKLIAHLLRARKRSSISSISSISNGPTTAMT